MSTPEKKYASVVGFVQFDPEEKVVSGQNILNFSVRAVGFIGQPLVQVTLWSEFEANFGDIYNGSFVAVDGRYTLNQGKYHNISASKLFVDGQIIEKGERSEGAPAAGGTTVSAPTEGGAF